MKQVVIQPKPIHDDVLESLYKNLCMARRAFGNVITGKETKRLYFIAPILLHLIDQNDRDTGEGDAALNISLLVEESMPGNNINVNGHFEFIIQRGGKKICIVEAKKDNMEQGMVQDLLGCEAVADTESMSCVYGIVTNYLNWAFFRSLDDTIEQENATLALEGGSDVGNMEGLKLILGKIYALLCD